MSDSEPYGLQPARLLCPRDSPGKNTGVGCHALLQGIFLPRDQTHISYVSCIGRHVLYLQSHLGSPLPSVSESKFVFRSFLTLYPCFFKIYSWAQRMKRKYIFLNSNFIFQILTNQQKHNTYILLRLFKPPPHHHCSVRKKCP